PGAALELGRYELAQRPVALRPAGEAVIGERAPLAREHRGRGRNQPVDRNLLGIVVAADEVIFRRASPFRRRRRQSRRQQRREIERYGGHGRCLPLRDVYTTLSAVIPAARSESRDPSVPAFWRRGGSRLSRFALGRDDSRDCAKAPLQ